MFGKAGRADLERRIDTANGGTEHSCTVRHHRLRLDERHGVGDAGQAQGPTLDGAPVRQRTLEAREGRMRGHGQHA